MTRKQLDHSVQKLADALAEVLYEAMDTAYAQLRDDLMKGEYGLPSEQAGDAAWSGKGVDLPHGTELKMTYHNQDHFGEIRDGKWLVNGESYGSPSTAARGVSGGASLNGWHYWYVKRPGHIRWTQLKRVRKRVRKR